MSIENSTRWGWFCPRTAGGVAHAVSTPGVYLPVHAFDVEPTEIAWNRVLTRLSTRFAATLTALTRDNFASEQGEAIRPNLPPLVSATKAGKRFFSCHSLGGRVQRAIYS